MTTDASESRAALTVDDLRRFHDQLVDIGGRYGVSNIRVFGSVARGEADEDSDLDLLVDIVPGRGLLALSAFAGDVEDAVHVVTQVATVGGLKTRIRERVLAEAILV